MRREGLRHPKTLDLMARLCISRREAIGLLDLLFDWCIDYAVRGDIGKWNNGVIAGAVDWTGDADGLVHALVACGWLDEHQSHRLIVHDWPQHAPAFVRLKLKKLGTNFLDCYTDAVEGSVEGSVEGAIPPLPSPLLPSPPLTSLVETPSESLSADADGEADASRFVGLWNSTKGVKRIGSLSQKRRKALRSRIREPVTTPDGCRLAWLDALTLALKKFPLQMTRGDPQGWLPDGDWILRPDSVLRVLEGKYDWSKRDARTNEPTAGLVYDESTANAPVHGW